MFACCQWEEGCIPNKNPVSVFRWEFAHPLLCYKEFTVKVSINEYDSMPGMCQKSAPIFEIPGYME